MNEVIQNFKKAEFEELNQKGIEERTKKRNQVA